MKIELNSDVTQDWEKASSKEWLETNGLGGWASSSISGANTRNYHGLFVVATHPPVGRMVLLSKLEENVILEGHRYELGCNQFPDKICDESLKHFTKFTKDIFPSFQYNIGTVEIIKTVAAIHGEDTVVVTYEVSKATGSFQLELQPFIAYRDYHSLAKVNDSINKEAIFGNGLLSLQPYPNTPPLNIYIKDSSFKYSPEWLMNFEYKQEQFRGLNYKEDLFCYGNFMVEMKQGTKISIIISTAVPKEKDGFKLIEIEKIRREKLFENLPVVNDFSKMLALAADQFLVKRGEDLLTILAGYHWFSDWGRDTMISLPGICLVNKRYDEAKKILKAFAQSIDEGMIPNRFPDVGEVPEYNTVDATLWFFISIKKYLDYSKDSDFVLKELLPALKEIISWHDNGTRYNIHVDKDGLLYAGEYGVQLTWMDAKIGNWVVTPRQGKAVEINALWYNALSIMSELTKMNKEKEESEQYIKRAEKVKAAFLEQFIIEDKGYLYDFIDGDTKDTAFRPNQIFAISLPYQLLDQQTSQSIVKQVEDKLLTPFGLRSLSPDHPRYIGIYSGDQLSRDGAYHQGTVWSWLLGPYITAKIRTEGEAGRAVVRDLLGTFSTHFNDAGIGTVSEIFDGNAPYTPKGCIAQAWGVAEVLRAYLEDLNPVEAVKGRKNLSMAGK